MRVYVWCWLYRGVLLYSLLEVGLLTMVVRTGSRCMIVWGMQQCAGMFGHLHSRKPAPAWCMHHVGYDFVTPTRPADVWLYLFLARDTHSVSVNIGYVMRQERSQRIIIAVFDSWEACSSSEGWLPVETRVFPSPIRVHKGLFLATVYSIHAAQSGVSRTGALYVWFTCMRCQILATLHYLPGKCDFPPAVTSQPLFNRFQEQYMGFALIFQKKCLFIRRSPNFMFQIQDFETYKWPKKSICAGLSTMGSTSKNCHFAPSIIFFKKPFSKKNSKRMC